MLYAVRYEQGPPGHREGKAFQRGLARKLLFFAMKKEYGVDREGLQLETGPYGKPYFADHPARFSISHCPGLVCCFVSGTEVGVDAEPLRPRDLRVAERVCTPEELRWLECASDRNTAFLRLWTLKESRAKLAGTGFRMGFQNAAFLNRDGALVPRDPEVKAREYFCVPGYAVSACSLEEPPETLELVSPGQLF